MNNEPVAWRSKDTDGHWSIYQAPVEGSEPLYTHQYERPHNTVLVPCDKLAEMQAEIALLKFHPAKTLIDDPLVNFKPIWQEKFELTLTDEEIWEVINRTAWVGTEEEIRFKIAEAILRKAQEK